MASKSKKTVFQITDILNQSSLEMATQKRKKINYKKLIPNEKNHYSMEGIKELADTIQDVGLLQDPIVKIIDKDNYKIYAGHRRILAITELVENRGLTSFEEVSCMVLEKEEDEEISQIKLHITNMTNRELTEYDKMTAIAELKELIVKAKKNGYVIVGNVKDIISESVNLKPTQVQKYMTINERAEPEIKEALKKGNITVTDAYQSAEKKNKKQSKPNKVSLLEKKFKAFKKECLEIKDPDIIKSLKTIEKWISENSTLKKIGKKQC